MQGITIVGPGRLGGALSIALEGAGYGIDSLVFRSSRGVRSLTRQLSSSPSVVRYDRINRINSPIVVLSVQDEEIGKTADAIAPFLQSGTAVFHTSGSLSSDILGPLRARGCLVASLHPLASISNWEVGQKRFAGAYFCIEGDQRAVRLGKKIVRDLRGHPLAVSSSKKALYHASALTAAGHVTALFDIALSLMVKAGASRPTARKMLQPLLFGVADNLSRLDTPQALTGTYARADVSTMARHLEALETDAKISEIEIYLDLALRSIELARQAGADDRKLKQMRRAIMVAKENLE